MRYTNMAELLHSNNNNMNDSSEIIALALKQLSRCRFKEEQDSVVVNIENNGELVNVRFTDELTTQELSNQIFIMILSEPSLDLLRAELDRAYQEESLIAVLKKYKEKYLIDGFALPKLLFKLYSPTMLDDPYRKAYHAKWIDYERQLKSGNYIFDEFKLNGLWSFPIKMLPEVLNSECKERYGSKLFILAPKAEGKYFMDDKEIIGDSYEVVESLDLSCIDDVGMMCESLFQYFKKESDDKEAILNEMRKTIEELNDNNSFLNRQLITRKKLEIINLALGLLIGISIMFLF